MNAENVRLLRRYKTICRNKGLTERSIEAVQGDLQLFLRFVEQQLSDKDLAEITHIHVEDFFSYCSEKRGNTNVTLNRKYAILNTFFKTMSNKEYLDMKNPLDKIDKIKSRKKLRGHLEKWEIDKLTEYCDTKRDSRGAALISLFFSSGIRLSELHQLSRDGLNFDTRFFKVLGKGQKERECSFSEDARDRILKYLAGRTDDKVPLFLSNLGRRWSRKAIQDYVKGLGIRAGLRKNVHPHLFRHSCAMHMLQNGVPLDAIQVYLGHENISTTQVYAHQDLRQTRHFADRVFNG